MGRGQLQGTPWHYEYAKGSGDSNSKNCSYNVGYCSHKYSQYHTQECVGKAYCDDFAQGISSKQDNAGNKSKKKSSQSLKEPSSKKSTGQGSLKPKEPPVKKGAIKPGDKIVVRNTSTQEVIELNISDPQNPFVGKILKQKVKIQKVVYEIDQINGKK